MVKRGEMIRMKFRKIGKLVCLNAILLIMTIGCRPNTRMDESDYVLSEENQLIVYTSHKKEIYEPLIKAFEEQTGIWVQVYYSGTTDLLKTIEENKDAFVCDVMFGGSAESLIDSEAYFLPYKCHEYDHLNTQVFSENYMWTPFSNLPLVIITNNKTVYSATAPRGWEDLLGSVWEDKVALANPQISGSSYTAIAMLQQLLRIDDELLVDTLMVQIGGEGESSSGVAIDNVASGRKQIGITLETTARQYIEAGENISIIYPIEGTAVIPDGTAILKNAKHIENAKKFVDFTVAKDTQEMLVNRFYRRSVRDDISCNENLPQNIVIMNFDVNWASENKEHILETWKNKSK